MTIYIGDQPTQAAVAVAGGVTGQADADTLAAMPGRPSTTVYVFSAYYRTMWHGFELTFRPGIPYQLDAELGEGLLAASAPMVAA